MVFFTNRCKNRIVHFLKNSTLQPSMVIIHWIAYIRGRLLFSVFCFFPHLVFQMNFHHFFLICSPGSPEKSLGTNHKRAELCLSAIKTKARALSCAQFSRHYQTVSHTVLRGVELVPAPKCGSVDGELLGWWQMGHMRSVLVVCCWASVWSEGCKGTG